MLIDAYQLPADQAIEAAVCIVGAGAAGITLARALAGAGIDVCLLESGGLEPDPAVQDLHRGEVTGLPYFDLDTCRLRYLGGTTNHWAGYCWRFRPQDFQARDWVPHSGWPIGYDEVYRFDRQVHEILDIAPQDFSLDYWLAQAGRPDFLLQEPDIGTEVVRFSPPTRFGPKYLPALKADDRIKLLLNANVVEIETEETAVQATGLAVQSLDGKRFAVRAGLYVLATGGIENPRLLLASNRRAPAGLGNGEDQVGRYFMDHPNIWRGAEIALSHENPRGDLYFPRFDDEGRYLTRAILDLPAETLRQEKLLGVSFYLEPIFRSKGVESLKSLIRSPANMDRHIPNIARDLDAVFDVIYRNVTGAREGPFGAEGDLVALDVRPALEQAPNPESRVRLGGERDPLGLPRIELDWRLTAAEKRSLHRALALLGLAVGRTGLGRLKVKLEQSDDPANWPSQMEGSNHHIGTTRMSDSPKTGVVDRNCRVHGMANLYVAGSSVFPTSGVNTPTYTIVALALRLAEHLRGELKGSG